MALPPVLKCDFAFDDLSLLLCRHVVLLICSRGREGHVILVLLLFGPGD